MDHEAARRRAPGAHVDETRPFPPSVAAVDTAVPAFIGYTETAVDQVADDLRLAPTRIGSLVEFEQHFGLAQRETGITVTIDETTVARPGTPVGITARAALDPANRSKHVMHHALRLFYANGGRSCVVVSVGGYKAVGDDLDAGELQAGLGPLSEVDEPTLIVIPEAQALARIADFGTLQDLALGQCGKLRDRFVIMDVHGADESLSDGGADVLQAVATFRAGGPTRDLSFGAAYLPNLVTTLEHAYDAAEVEVTHVVDGVASGPVPMNTLDEPLAASAKAAIRALPVVLPPSPALAGVYTKVDDERGVWKAPANVPLAGVVEPTVALSDAQNDEINGDAGAGRSVNAIRAFAGRGTLVWGARTLADQGDEWRYVPIRRFFLMMEESIGNALASFTFEPNDATTWATVQTTIESFLATQWRAGALQGVEPEHAFYVAVGLGRTMTAQDIVDGRMIVEIGMAVVRPAEFTVLRLSHTMAQP